MFRRRERIYVGVISFLIAILLFVVSNSNDNYKNQLEVNEQTYQALEKVRQQKDETIKEWEESYHDLILSYEDLANNYNILREVHESYILDDSQSKIVIEEYGLTQEDIYLLAQCVEAEAGYITYSSELEQQYICQVILNRLKSDNFPNTMREVIYQKVKGIPQFSVAYNGMMEEHSQVDAKTLVNVYIVLAYGTELPDYVTYFYSSQIEENWVNTLPIYCEVGRTVFAYHESEIE